MPVLKRHTCNFALAKEWTSLYIITSRGGGTGVDVTTPAAVVAFNLASPDWNLEWISSKSWRQQSQTLSCKHMAIHNQNQVASLQISVSAATFLKVLLRLQNMNQWTEKNTLSVMNGLLYNVRRLGLGRSGDLITIPKILQTPTLQVPTKYCSDKIFARGLKTGLMWSTCMSRTALLASENMLER